VSVERTSIGRPVLRAVPNLLSTLRLVLAVALPLSPRDAWLPIVLAAGASDFLDGVIARRYGLTSWYGGIIDAVADKAFVLSALYVLCVHGPIEPWQVPLLLLRDVAVAAGVLASLLRGDRDAFRHMDSRWFGKITTAALFALFAAVLVWPDAHLAYRVLFAFAALASACAAVDYGVARFRTLRGR
jgi:CDP-diacylglycerol--glycerol-3-phosphate 3-phosphatidyltransferase/cardiolipin synthase